MGKDVGNSSQGGVATQPGRGAGVSARISHAVGGYFRTLSGGMGSGVSLGIVLSGLGAAIASWWLSGKNMLAGIMGGLVTALGLPALIGRVSPVATRSRKASENAAGDGARARTPPAVGGADATVPDVRAAVGEVDEINAMRLGDLSALLPRAKGPRGKRGLP